MAVKIQKMRFKIFAIASPLQDDTVAEAQHRAAQTSTEQRRAVQDEIKKDEIQKIYPWGGGRNSRHTPGTTRGGLHLANCLKLIRFISKVQGVGGP